MDQNNKQKPTDENTLKSRIVLSQIRIQESFKDPIKCLSALLLGFVYIQCLKYSIDFYSVTWF